MPHYQDPHPGAIGVAEAAWLRFGFGAGKPRWRRRGLAAGSAGYMKRALGAEYLLIGIVGGRGVGGSKTYTGSVRLERGDHGISRVGWVVWWGERGEDLRDGVAEHGG
jgi:hypothetical protein